MDLKGLGLGLFTRWEPDPDEFQRCLKETSPPLIRLDRFPYGIDNAHIDVTLSSQFVGKTQSLVQSMLRYQVGKYQGLNIMPAPERQAMDGLIKLYRQLAGVALDQARRSSRPEFIQLLQFAVWKFILQQVATEVERFQRELKEGFGAGPQSAAGKGLQFRETKVMQTRERYALGYRLAQYLFRDLRKLEGSDLQRLRQSIIGMAWPVPKEILFNPLLLIPSFEADEQVMEHYPLLLTELEWMRGFKRCNDLVTGHFANYLPQWMQPVATRSGAGAAAGGNGRLKLSRREDQGVLPGFLEIERTLATSLNPQELEGNRLVWIDSPENFDRVLYPELPLVNDQGADGAESEPSGLQDQPRWRDFQRAQAEALFRAFRKADLLQPVIASNATPRVYRQLLGKIPARDILHYLGGHMSRSRLRQRLRGFQLAEDAETLLKELGSELRRIKRMTPQEQREELLRFLREFAAFRRDLKYGLLAHQAMDRIRLITELGDIQLSRANGRLQEFSGPEGGAKQPQQRIRNHVVLKADVRGSTEITAQLVEKHLNPASYFSLNFFGPINKLIEAFGARKIFIEGDAIILSIFEYEDLAYRWLSVAHACVLARKILEVIDAQNAQNRRHGLPDLELGIGIAFSDGSPNFLYDGDNQIMISPAINRADRLSSCAAALRRSALNQMVGGRGVEGVSSTQGDEEKLLRYNVNGIELEAPAYFKLKMELALQRVDLEVAGGGEPQRYFVGQAPDRNGQMHLLVVREAPIRIWIGNDFSTLEHRGRHFFEVIADRRTLSRVRERLQAAPG